jgi:hypothetical protein
MIGAFYRIHYCDLDGRDAPVYEAEIYRMFSLNKREAEKRNSSYGA